MSVLHYYIVAALTVVSGCNNSPTDHSESMQENNTIEDTGIITLVIQGGAGTIKKENMTSETEQAYYEKLTEALNTGYAILEKGGTSVEAVIGTIQVMEESPLFNSGKGAVFTSEGINELDASIMDGSSGMAGAVAGVKTIKSPIAAAYEVMTHSPYVMMTGSGAEEFARMRGLEMADPEYFFTQRRYEQLMKIKEKEAADKSTSTNKTGREPDFPDKKFGTVGAVALDRYGNIAAGTSTGGMTNKKFGRVGDSPIIGAGTFAENATCGISSTGHGEYFIRNVVAYDISAQMKYAGKSLDDAAKAVVMEKLAQAGGSGGVVGLDRKGNITMTFNSEGMYRGFIKEIGKPEIFIYKN